MVLALGSLINLMGNLIEQATNVAGKFIKVRGDGSGPSGFGGTSSLLGISTLHKCSFFHAIYHVLSTPSYLGVFMYLLFGDSKYDAYRYGSACSSD